MTTDLAPTLMCVSMRNGVELWISAEKAQKIQDLIGTITESKFVTITGTFGERTVNTADIVGIFTPQDMEESKRRKNGEWKCSYGHWHGKRETCAHKDEMARMGPALEPLKPRTPEEAKRVDGSLAKLRAQKNKILGKVTMR